MSLVRASWLTCDGPGDAPGNTCDNASSYEAGGAADTVARTRQLAAQTGWHRTRDGRDICEFCWEEGVR